MKRDSKLALVRDAKRPNLCHCRPLGRTGAAVDSDNLVRVSKSIEDIVYTTISKKIKVSPTCVFCEARMNNCLVKEVTYLPLQSRIESCWSQVRHSEV